MSTLNIKPGLNQLPAGTFNFTAAEIPAGAKIKGVAGQTIINGDYHIGGDGVTLDGVTVAGAIKADKPSGGMNDQIILNNCDFKNGSFTFTSGLSNSQITNNGFTGNPTGGFGLYGYNYQNLEIAYNEFPDITAGAHIQGFGNSSNLHAHHNYFSGVRNGMGFEFQGSATGDIIEDNYYDEPNQTTTDGSKLTNFMAFSLPLDEGKNTIIRRNYIKNINRPDKIGVRIGIECGGDNTQVYDNCIIGTNASIACTDGSGTCSVNIHDNLITGAISMPQQVNAGPGRICTMSNNGPNVKLTWDTNRPRPRRNMLGGAPAPTPTPEPSMPDSPSGTYITTIGPTLVIGGVTCGIAAGGRVSINGAPDTGTSAVVGVLSFNGKFYQQQANQWWVCADAAPKIGSKYARVNDPRATTPPVTPPPSDPIVVVLRVHASGKVDVEKP